MATWWIPFPSHAQGWVARSRYKQCVSRGRITIQCWEFHPHNPVSIDPVGGVWPGESRNRFPAFHYIRRFIDSDSDFWHSCLLCDDINFSGFSFCRLRWRCPMTAFFLTDGVNGSERSMATFQYYSFGVWSHSSTNRQLLLFVDNHWYHTRTLMVVILINSRLGDILLLYRITLLLISVPLFLGIWFKVSSSA